MKKKPSVVEKPIQIEMRSITNSHVIPLTEKLGFTDEIWNEPELMEEFMTWCVRIFFDLDGNSRLIDLTDRNNIAKSFGNMIYGSGIANLFYSVGEENINYNKIYGTELLFSI